MILEKYYFNFIKNILYFKISSLWENVLELIILELITSWLNVRICKGKTNKSSIVSLW